MSQISELGNGVEPEYVPNQVIIRVKERKLYDLFSVLSERDIGNIDFMSIVQDSQIHSLINELGINRVRHLHYVSDESFSFDDKFSRSFVIYHKISTSDAISILENIEGIEYALPNYIYRIYKYPNDPLYKMQWYLDKVEMPLLWDHTVGCNDVIVAVIDGGFQEHMDMIGKWDLFNGRDEVHIDTVSLRRSYEVFYGNNYGIKVKVKYLRNEDYVWPDNNAKGLITHGTSVASVIGANTDNQAGMASVGWNIGILPVRIGALILIESRNSSWYLHHIPEDFLIRAIDWVVLNSSASVINISLGRETTKPNPDMELSLKRAIEHNIPVIASGGNTPPNQPTRPISYPASSKYTIAVGATDSHDYHAQFSSYGSSHLDIVAPGDSILVAEGNGYKLSSGTSFSAPIVSGIVGMIKVVVPYYTPSQIRQLLRDSADKVSGMKGRNFDPKYGYGRVNANRIINHFHEMEVVVDNWISVKDTIIQSSAYIISRRSIVKIGDRVEFRARKSVTLEPGFHAKEGSVFKAWLYEPPCRVNRFFRNKSPFVDQTFIDDDDNIYSNTTSFELFEDDDNENDSNIKLFPNPCFECSTINVKIDQCGPHDLYNVFVLSLTGRVMRSYMNVSSCSVKIPAHYIPDGSFYVRIVSDEKVYSFLIHKM